MTQRLKMKRDTYLCEYLSEDILEVPFVSAVTPFLNVQKICGTSRVEVKDQFVSPPSKLNKAYSVVYILAGSYFSLTTGFSYTELFYSDLGMKYLSRFQIIVSVIAFLILALNVRFYNNDANVDFYIKMQRIDKLMGIERNKTIYQCQRFIDAASVVFLISIAGATASLSFCGGLPMGTTVNGLALSALPPIFELAHCSNITQYFMIRVRFINGLLKNYYDKKPVPKPKYNIFMLILTKKATRYLATQTHDFRTSATDVYLKNILECFEDFYKLYRFAVLIQFINYSTFLVSSFQLIIIGFKKNIMTFMEFGIFSTAIVIVGGVDVFLNLRCELLLQEVRETKRFALEIMSVCFDGPLHEKAKNMIRLIEAMPPKFSMYDVWSFDAKFLVTCFKVVSSIFVSQLQFIYL